MRITGGILRGRTLKVPRRDVRPTTDMVREALFSILGEQIIDARFLDMYGGSGAVGLEAWSRGAEQVCWIEEDGAVLKVLSGNVQQLCESGTRIIKGDVLSTLKRGSGGEGPFDIIFADPPYIQTTEDRRLMAQLLDAVADGGVLKQDGLFVMELPKRGGVTVPDDWVMVTERVYGRTKLCFFRRND